MAASRGWRGLPHDLVDRDALTGLLTRRRFEKELERHVAQGRRYGFGGVLIVLDLNGFRSINEQHGPRAGDRVLYGVAQTLSNRLRETDLLARIGGDQFGVLLPRAKPPEAERVCQALEDAIPEEVHAPGGRVTSAGCARFRWQPGARAPGPPLMIGLPVISGGLAPPDPRR